MPTCSITAGGRASRFRRSGIPLMWRTSGGDRVLRGKGRMRAGQNQLVGETLMAGKKKKDPDQKLAQMRWEFDRYIPTSDFFDGLPLTNSCHLQEAVDNF